MAKKTTRGGGMKAPSGKNGPQSTWERSTEGKGKVAPGSNMNTIDRTTGKTIKRSSLPGGAR